MNRSVDLLTSQVFPVSDEIDFALPSKRSYDFSCEAATNVAANEEFDGCEQESSRLTPVDELLKIDHWKPAEPQFCKEIAAHYGQSKRNIQKWFVDLREIAPWFSDAELRLSDDRYSPLAVELLGHRYFTGSKKKWESVLRGLFADRVEAWNFAQSEPAPEVPIAGRLSLPTIAPVSSAIVPSGQILPTDTREAKTLAATGKQAIENNSQDLEQIRNLLKQVNSFVDSKINHLDQETETTQQQVQELKDLAFQLEVKQESLRRAEIRNAAAREESEAAKVAATNKVVHLSDFFAKKSTPQSGF